MALNLFDPAIFGDPPFDATEDLGAATAPGSTVTAGASVIAGAASGNVTRPAWSLLTSGSTATNGTSFATASVTLTAGRLYLLAVTTDGVNTTDRQVPTGVSHAAGAFSLVDSQIVDAYVTQSLWALTPSTTTSGVVTISQTLTQDIEIWSLLEVTGNDAATPIGTIAKATGTGSTLSIAAITPQRVMPTLIGINTWVSDTLGTAATATPNTAGGWVEASDNPQNESGFSISQQVQALTGDVTGSSVTWSAAANALGSMVIEVRANIVGGEATASGATVSAAASAIGGAASVAFDALQTRRNLAASTDEFDSAYWATVRGAIAADSARSPEGDLAADKLTCDTSASSHYTRTSAITIDASGNVTASVFFRPDTSPGVRLSLYDTATATDGCAANFLGEALTISSAGPTGSGSYSGATIQSIGGGWVRASITGRPASGVTSARLQISLLNTAGTTSSFTDATATTAVFLWGAQVEAGDALTLYQPVGASWAATPPPGATVVARPTVIAGAASAAVNATATGDTVTATASVVSGAAAGGTGTAAAGATVTATASAVAGAATGQQNPTGPGATVSATSSAIAGAATGTATAPGATTTSAASVIAGTASAGVAGNAAGATVSAAGSAIGGAATGTATATGPGATVAATASALAGAASGTSSATATGATVSAAAGALGGAGSGTATATGATVQALASAIGGPAGAQGNATALGATAAATAAAIPGAATGTATATASGATVIAASSVIAGTASGASAGTAPGATVVATLQLVAGTATGQRQPTAAGAIVTATASVIPGAAGAAISPTAPGATVQAQLAALAGAATGGTGASAPGATVAALASTLAGAPSAGATIAGALVTAVAGVIAGTATGQATATGAGAIVTAFAFVLPGLAYGPAANSTPGFVTRSRPRRHTVTSEEPRRVAVSGGRSRITSRGTP